MLNITIDQRDLQVMLGGLRDALSDLTPVWGTVEDILIDLTKEHFKSEGAYVEGGWVPLSPGYARWKERHYPDQTILRLRDRLYGSLIEKGHPEHVRYDGPSFLEYGTNVPYAAAHHFGVAARNLPQRPVLSRLSRAEGERIVDAILAFLFKQMRGTR